MDELSAVERGENASDTGAESTVPEGAGVHFDWIRRNTPDWLINAEADVRTAFRESVVSSEASRRQVESVIKKLQTIEAFTTPLLVQSLEREINKELDVTSTNFIKVPIRELHYAPRVYRIYFFLTRLQERTTSQTLLEAALQNFEADEFCNFSKATRFQGPQLTSATILPVEPSRFVSLCRELDLGAKYQEHIDQVFNPKLPDQSRDSSVKTQFVDSVRNTFSVEVHLAKMKGWITSTDYQTLISLIKAHPVLSFDGSELKTRRLSLFGVQLTGLALVENQSRTGRCIAYIPGDSQAPLRSYNSFNEFSIDLCEKLMQPGYQRFFSRFVPEKDRIELFNKRNFNPWTSIRLVLTMRTALIHFSRSDMDGNLFENLHEQYLVQIKAHARHIAVPTQDVDQRARDARIHAYIEAGETLLFLAASFVPVLSEILLATSAIQLANEFYHGVDAWLSGEREQATTYLVDVAQAVVVMAAMGAVGKGVKAILAPESVERLLPVMLANGQQRLWKPDLVSYRTDLDIASMGPPTPEGLYELDGKSYLPLQGHVYRVTQDAATEQWSIEHPQGSTEHYRPRLKHNGVGAWQHIHEQPATWTTPQLFRRLGHSVAGFSETRLRQLMWLGRTEEAVLRQTLVSNQPPPALLADAITRANIDQAIQHFAQASPETPSPSLEHADLQVRLLASLPSWPSGKVIRIVDAKGEMLQEYGHPTSSASSSLQLLFDQLKQKRLLDLILTMLNETERHSLFGETLADAAISARKLDEMLRQWAGQRKRKLFQEVYASQEHSDDPRVGRILRSFPGLPSSVARELIAHATSTELSRLNERVPLRFQEEIRWYLKDVGLYRVCESWYLETVMAEQSDRLALHTLVHLPLWPKSGLRVDLRKDRLLNPSVESIGAKNAMTLRVILKVGTQYNVFDAAAVYLGRSQTIFGALFEALPASARKALPEEKGHRDQLLRDQLVEHISRNPSQAKRVLGIIPDMPRFKPPMRLASGRLGYPLSMRIPIAGRADLLVNRVRGLYPGFTRQEVGVFLDRLNLSGRAAVVELERLRVEYETLSRTLADWSERQTWRRVHQTQVVLVPKANKRRVVEAILACWRRQSARNLVDGESCYELDLLGLRVGDLPPIQSDFSHVGLWVTRMEKYPLA